jgi:hypothetical protein
MAESESAKQQSIAEYDGQRDVPNGTAKICSDQQKSIDQENLAIPLSVGPVPAG